MEKPSLQEIDALRQENIRPGVVGCFFNDDKILFVYKAEHNLWQLPQGGIDNHEDIDTAFAREMEEELGKGFAKNISGEITVHGVDILRFPEHLHGSRKLVTDEGEEKIMQGKAYFFCKAEVSESSLNLEESEFDEYRWLTISEAHTKVDEIYQKGKQKITRNALAAVAG